MSTSRSRRTSSTPAADGLKVQAAPGRVVPIIVSGAERPIAAVATEIEDVILTVSVKLPVATFEDLELVAKQGVQGSWRAHVLPPRADAGKPGKGDATPSEPAAMPELTAETPSEAALRVTDFDVTLTKSGDVQVVVVGSGLDTLNSITLDAPGENPVTLRIDSQTETRIEAEVEDIDALSDGLWTPHTVHGEGEFEFDPVELKVSSDND